MYNFTQKIIKQFFFAQLHVSTCPEMLLMELLIWQGNGQVFSWPTLISVLLMLEQYRYPNNSTPKNDFSQTPSNSTRLQTFEKKDLTTCLPFSLQRGESSYVSWIKKYNCYHQISFCYPKNLGLALVIMNSM